MRLELSHKLAIVVLLPLAFAAALSLYALVQAKVEADRSERIATLSGDGLRARDLAAMVQDRIVTLTRALR